MSKRIARLPATYLSLILLAVLTGCASRPPLSRVKLPEFKEGETTFDEVLTKLGKPASSSRLVGHGLLLRYVEGDSEISTEARLLGLAARNAGVVRIVSLSFIFGEDRKLQQQLVSTAVLPVEGGNQGVHLGPPLNAAVMSQWQRGRTTMNEVFAQLGEPAAQLLSLDGGLVMVWMRVDFIQFQKAGIREQSLAARFSESGQLEEFGLMGRDQAIRAFP